MSPEETIKSNQEIKVKFDEYLKTVSQSQTDPSPYAVDPFDLFKAGYLIKQEPKDGEYVPSGNQATSHLKEFNETLHKVNKDEPIFVLRAQDKTAPEIILHWIAKNMDTVSEAKLKEAFQTAIAMRRYDSRRDPT